MKYVIILLFTPIISFSQEIIKQEIDPFTKDKLVETSLVNLGDQNFMTTLKGDQLELIQVYYSNVEYFMKEGDKLMFLLGNSDVVELECPFNSMSLERDNPPPGALYIYRLEIHYQINKAEYSKLQDHEVIKIRWQTDRGEMDSNVKPGRAKKLQKMFNLIRI